MGNEYWQHLKKGGKIMSIIHQRLKELREGNCLSQQYVAKMMDVAPSTYLRYEQGERKFSFQFAIEIAEFYGVSIDYIAGLTNNPKPRDEE